jgi:hypothetical protein
MFFGLKVGDFHCGLRAFDREKIRALELRTTGMEFASELVVRSAFAGYRIEEVPTTLSPDGRSRPPHLRTWRDGWRHLSFLLVYSPRWLFLYPGLALIAVGLLGAVFLLPGQVMIDGVGFDIHTFIMACMSVLLGTQSLGFAVIARRFAVSHRLTPPPRTSYSRVIDALTLERVLIGALVLGVAGLGGVFWSVFQWASIGFGPLEYSTLLRVLILSMTTLAVAFQAVFLAFFSAITEVPVR